jgi:hypothetical protein
VLQLSFEGTALVPDLHVPILLDRMASSDYLTYIDYDAAALFNGFAIDIGNIDHHDGG